MKRQSSLLVSATADYNNRCKQSLVPGLYLVATPIGNLDDITLRALRILHCVDIVACEDTRVTAHLLSHYGLANIRRISYHEYNAQHRRPEIIQYLKNGNRVALVSNAGTPLISDPGYKLVCDCLEQGLSVIPIPGASAVLTALMLAGLPSDRFLFAGFPPSKMKARRRWLTELASIRTTLILMESPKRLAASLIDMVKVLGNRPVTVARELTKFHEEARRGTLADLAVAYSDEGLPKGEITLVIGPPQNTTISDREMDLLISESLSRSSLRDTVVEVAQITGCAKKVIYARALALSKLL